MKPLLMLIVTPVLFLLRQVKMLTIDLLHSKLHVEVNGKSLASLIYVKIKPISSFAHTNISNNLFEINTFDPLTFYSVLKSLQYVIP